MIFIVLCNRFGILTLPKTTGNSDRTAAYPTCHPKNTAQVDAALPHSLPVPVHLPESPWALIRLDHRCARSKRNEAEHPDRRFEQEKAERILLQVKGLIDETC